MQWDEYLHLPNENLMEILKFRNIRMSPRVPRDPLVFQLGECNKIGQEWTPWGDPMVFIFIESFHRVKEGINLAFNNNSLVSFQFICISSKRQKPQTFIIHCHCRQVLSRMSEHSTFMDLKIFLPSRHFNR